MLPGTIERESTVEDLFPADRETRNDETTLYAWQVEQLARLGLSGVIATAFAGLVDWHDVARLVQRGCPPELALEIAR